MKIPKIALISGIVLFDIVSVTVPACIILSLDKKLNPDNASFNDLKVGDKLVSINFSAAFVRCSTFKTSNIEGVNHIIKRLVLDYPGYIPSIVDAGFHQESGTYFYGLSLNIQTYAASYITESQPVKFVQMTDLGVSVSSLGVIKFLHPCFITSLDVVSAGRSFFDIAKFFVERK